MAARALPGSEPVSTNSSTIFLPRMPPAALISSTASEEPFFQLAPTVAPAPDSSMMLGILMVSCAQADGATTRAAATAIDVTKVLRCMGDVSSYVPVAPLVVVLLRGRCRSEIGARRTLQIRRGAV